MRPFAFEVMDVVTAADRAATVGIAVVVGSVGDVATARVRVAVAHVGAARIRVVHRAVGASCAARALEQGREPFKQGGHLLRLQHHRADEQL